MPVKQVAPKKPAKKQDASTKTISKATKTKAPPKTSKASGGSGSQAKHYYFFGKGKADGNAEMLDLLGGKGANLAEMTNAGLPVPPGFTITTEVCRQFYANSLEVSKSTDKELESYVQKIEKVSGKRFGDPKNPLLVSVRSGSKFSMPGMMDTILNLGLNSETVDGLSEQTKNLRFALDNYRRFIQMFGHVVLGIDKELFEDVIIKKKKERRVKQDSSLHANDFKDIIRRFKQIVVRKSGEKFPEEPYEQLRLARDAVFRSWNNPRTITYRRLKGISSVLGTAVTVQAMVFGNMGGNSCTGVGFTRNPATGKKEFYGEFLINAQGEDIVAGVRNAQPIAELGKEMPGSFKELKQITARLETRYRDLQDFEFTVEEGKLFMLQTRIGQRSAQAAIKIAVDMVKEKLISKEEAILRIDPISIDQVLHPRIDPKAKVDVIARGLAASPGAVSGKVYFTAEDAANAGSKVDVILVREATSADDIEGMNVAVGFLTSRGSTVSHAAVVARGMGKCCVSGCEAIRVNVIKKQFQVGRLAIKEGEIITLNGSTGEVMLGKVPTIEPEMTPEFNQLMAWADEFRCLGVRANADTPQDAAKAVEFGAEGIGLCRTEHMFFGDDRISIVQDMILAESPADRQAALDKLLPMAKKDFKGLFDAMKGLPVTIRTLDPPLHEFLPKAEELQVQIDALDPKGDDYEEEFEVLDRTLKRIEALTEVNPMLGHRGCRLGIVYPEITEMQVRAILLAAIASKKNNPEVFPEIMIPLVGHINEFKNQKEVVDRVAHEILSKGRGKDIPYKVGTMIEIPRAALTAGEIAAEAEFFSFGTNDLTQLAMGFSRDDVGKFLSHYIENDILPEDPFVSIDISGVGRLVKMATDEGRKSNPNLKVGICGEHGGDPASIEFCHSIGLDYVSCSPFRVPIARIAAAQAAIRAGDTPKRKSKRKK